MQDAVFHCLQTDVELPRQLNNPFCYEPHPLCRIAAREVCDHLAASPLKDEVMAGKMLGVLICQDGSGQPGFLAAYSGQIGGRADWPWFVPAVFDYLQPDGYFKQEEAAISAINHAMAELEQAEAFTTLKSEMSRLQQQAAREEADYRRLMAEAKQRRDERRAAGEDTDELVRESQYQKAELRRLKQRWKARRTECEERLRPYEQQIAAMKEERRSRSDALQRWLFDHFVMVNDGGERRTLTDIFATTRQHVPPSGAGECCAPKLLQYAFLHGLRPLAIAEFWQGRSPKQEVRHHGSYYPACRGKCKPILEWMLKGKAKQKASPSPSKAKASPSPSKGGDVYIDKAIEGRTDYSELLSIVYIDKAIEGRTDYSELLSIQTSPPFIVVTKPSGLLSVPGLTGEESVESLLRRQYGEAYIVHRLDQDTSGLMVVALTSEAHRQLQQQFLARTIYKRYEAVVEGEVSGSGTISLPLRPDVDDRPRQLVDHEHGKEAVTDYEVLAHEGGNTRLALTPHTGRTHQLRVHCAHAEGLGCPIVGDRLYGRPARRLLLHATELAFDNPLTGERLTFVSPAPF